MLAGSVSHPPVSFPASGDPRVASGDPRIKNGNELTERQTADRADGLIPVSACDNASGELAADGDLR